VPAATPAELDPGPRGRSFLNRIKNKNLRISYYPKCYSPTRDRPSPYLLQRVLKSKNHKREAKESFLQQKPTNKGSYYRTGSRVTKTSKYDLSSNYLRQTNTTGKPTTHPISKPAQSPNKSLGTNNKNEWILCQRKNQAFRPKLLINHTRPNKKHERLQAPTTRQWERKGQTTFKPRLFNYFSPLSEFTHGIVVRMPKEKEKEAVVVKANMIKLRMGGQAVQQNKISFHQSGRGGGRLPRGVGRGGGGMTKMAPALQPTITSMLAKSQVNKKHRLQ
jgi:hypothetical protein